MSITFSSSDSLSSSSSPRGEKDERNETQRRTNETKRKELFATARPTSSAQTSHFCLPRPFRRRLRNDLRINTYILLHHRSTSRSRRRTHSARARASSSFPLSLLLARFTNENKRRKKHKVRELRLVSRPRSFGTISVQSYFGCIVHHHRSTLGEETEEEEKSRVVVVVVVVVSVFESAHLLVFISEVSL